jgi:hypothetical protein
MDSGRTPAGSVSTTLPAAPSLEDLRSALAALAVHDGAGLPESEIIDHLRAMELLKSGLAAAQARLTARLAAMRTQREPDAGLPADRRCRGLGHEVGLARQESPVRGQQHLGLATALVREMPHTLAALTRGEISEWRATLVVRETAVLSRVHRTEIDRELAGQLAGAGDRKVADLARAIGYRLDPGSALRRVRGAESDRRVGMRPAPDTMSRLTALLPVAQGVACYATLRRDADSKRAAGDPRSRGQIMADTLVERVTGRAADDGVPTEVHLVMTDQTLFAGDHAPAHLDGYGPIPDSLARSLVRDADTAWIRRLYTSPEDGSLVAMDSRRRSFDGQLRRFVVARDQTCRSAWCDAPVRHADHVTRAADGGATTADNGQGLCESCNYAKESAGWSARRVPGERHPVETTTPTGHTYLTRAPDPPGRRRPPPGYPVQIDFFHAA